MYKISFCEIWSFWRLFPQAPIEIFSLELFHITNITFIAHEKCLYKKECNDWNYFDTDFVHWKFKWLNFLRDSVLITSEHIDKKQKFHQVTHMKMIYFYNYN